MQISEMRTLRTLHTLINSKLISNPNLLFSNSTKTQRFACHRQTNFFHSNEGSSGSEGELSAEVNPSRVSSGSSSWADENPQIWTGYEPVSETLEKRIKDGLVEGLKAEEAGSGDENPMTLSSLGSLIEPEEESSPEAAVKSRSNFVPKMEKIKIMDNRGSWSNSGGRDSVLKKKKSKSKVSWVCSDCGESYGQWWGSCRHCSGMLTRFVEKEDVQSKPSGFNVSEKAVGSWLQQEAGEMAPQRLSDVNKGINKLTWRIPLPGLLGAEVSRVLGGGLVPGSLVLVGGDPGVGKSTLLLQIAAMVAEGYGSGQPAPVLYVSGEESIDQIGNRADRMGIRTEELFLYSSTDIEDILQKIKALSPRALIVDSIQTVYLKGVTGSAGGIFQVKECTSALLRFAKQTGIPVLLIGHVTKTGDIAGPRVLEHIVDVVLYMEGERYSAHRFLRSVKNRFGSTDELGVFEMSKMGLQAVSNPSEIFLSEQNTDSEVLAGLAVAVIIDGSRTFLLEIQALCLSDTPVSRHFNGVESSRMAMIISVLVKQAGLKLQNYSIFVNIVSGVKLTETAGDLAIVAAICSSFLEFPIPNHFAFIGEVGLAGELRPVPRMEKRVNAVAKLGYKKCIVPKSAEKLLAALKFEDMMIVGCKNLKEVINIVFV